MRWQSTENNDDITDIRFHPSRRNHLLSGGIDGLVSIFDTDVKDEDDSLLQVVNHGPIHKAGFLSDEVVFALSHDEQFSIHAVTSDAIPFAGSLSENANPITSDIPPVHFGDLRPVLHCDYVIDVLQVDGSTFVATGTHTRYVKSVSFLKELAGLKGMEAQGERDLISRWLMYCHSEPHVDLVQLQTIPNSCFLYDKAIRLIGAHGEEIVRSVYVDASVSH